MDIALWILLIVVVMGLTIYVAMRVGGRGHRDQEKSGQRHLDEVEQPKRFWF
jgi:hypothetical protein